MNTIFASVRQAMWVSLACVGTMGAATANAGNVYWSVGVQAPGVVVGVGAPPQVVMAPQAAWGYGLPQAYYGPPAVVYVPPPPIYRSSWEPPRYYPRWKHEHHRHGHGGPDRWGEYER